MYCFSFRIPRIETPEGRSCNLNNLYRFQSLGYYLFVLHSRSNPFHVDQSIQLIIFTIHDAMRQTKGNLDLLMAYPGRLYDWMGSFFICRCIAGSASCSSRSLSVCLHRFTFEIRNTAHLSIDSLLKMSFQLT